MNLISHFSSEARSLTHVFIVIIFLTLKELSL